MTNWIRKFFAALCALTLLISCAFASGIEQTDIPAVEAEELNPEEIGEIPENAGEAEPSAASADEQQTNEEPIDEKLADAAQEPDGTEVVVSEVKALSDEIGQTENSQQEIESSEQEPAEQESAEEIQPQEAEPVEQESAEEVQPQETEPAEQEPAEEVQPQEAEHAEDIVPAGEESDPEPESESEEEKILNLKEGSPKSIKGKVSPDNPCIVKATDDYSRTVLFTLTVSAENSVSVTLDNQIISLTRADTEDEIRYTFTQKLNKDQITTFILTSINGASTSFALTISRMPKEETTEPETVNEENVNNEEEPQEEQEGEPEEPQDEEYAETAKNEESEEPAENTEAEEPVEEVKEEETETTEEPVAEVNEEETEVQPEETEATEETAETEATEEQSAEEQPEEPATEEEPAANAAEEETTEEDQPEETVTETSEDPAQETKEDPVKEPEKEEKTKVKSEKEEDEPAMPDDATMLEMGYCKVQILRKSGADTYAEMAEDTEATAHLELGDELWVKPTEDRAWAEIYSMDEEEAGYILWDSVLITLQNKPEETKEPEAISEPEESEEEVPEDAEETDEAEEPETAEEPVETEEAEETETPEETEEPLARSVTLKSTLDGVEYIEEGTIITITAELEGFHADDQYEVKWAYSNDNGESFHIIEGANELTYSYAIDEENAHNIWRIIVSVE